MSASFWKNMWLDGSTLEVCVSRLFEVVDNKLETVAEMHFLGLEVNGEAWKWSRSLFAWEENLVRENVGRISHVIL
jgi:hypothetical protein